MKEPRSLTPSQLAFIDTLITKAQQKGYSSQEVLTPPNTTETLTDAHKPYFLISEHDERIIGQIRDLASQMEFSVTLSRLMELRAEAVRNLA